MRNSTDLLLIGVVFAVIAGVVLFFRWWYLSWAMSAWGAFARSHGLDFDSRAPRIAGTVDGVELEVLTEQRRAGRSTATYTMLRCSVEDAVGRELSLSKQGLGGMIMNSMGVGDELLDAENPGVFDRFFWMKGLNPRVRSVLGEATVQRALIDNAKEVVGLSIRNGILQVETDHLVTSTAALEELLERSLFVQRALSRTVG